MTGLGAPLTVVPCSPSHSTAVVPTVETPLFHYVVVRGDIPRGLQAAQIVHAAGESSPGNLSSGTHAVCLVVPGEKELLEVAERLAQGRVPFVSIYEPDAPWNNQFMAIGCMPARKEVLRRYLSSLPLLR